MIRLGRCAAAWVAAIVVIAGTVQAAETVSTSAYSGYKMNWCWGGDIRIREVHFDNIPIVADPPGVTRGDENHFFRFRTRLWGCLDAADNIQVRGRLVNEFRRYEQPTDQSSADALDEIVVDQLFVDFKNLFGGAIDLRVGRQDLIYGTGKILLEGTPKDGSRTIYHDAVKLTYKGLANNILDILAIYNQCENELVINSRDRDLTGYDSAYNNADESGLGVYLKNAAFPAMPLELYYFLKHESEWTARGGAAVPSRDVHCVGFRAMPKFGEALGANVEAAYQFGQIDDAAETDIEGYMLDAVLTWNVPVASSLKPTLGVGYYHLSGDDPDTAEDEGWNPLWARFPQYSELYIYAYDADAAGRWSNLSMPHVDVGMMLGKVTVKGMVGFRIGGRQARPERWRTDSTRVPPCR